MKKPFSPILCLIIILGFNAFSVYGQECCIEQPIDGETCESCTADEWDPIFSPDLSNDDQWGTGGSCFLEGLSETIDGGGYAVMANTEGITTTISGLIPGSTYAYGFQYANPEVSCISSEGELTLELDGNSITYPQSSDWETVIECFVASDTEVTVTFIGNIASGSFGLSTVDALSCEYVSDNNTCANCCEIELDYNESPIVCKEVSFQVEPILNGNSGTVDVEWTSTPSDGINFLSDTDIINPTFTYTDQDENPELEYIFTLKVTDDNCEEEIEITVTVLPSEIPEFENIELCATTSIEDLPVVSENGYTGTWSGGPISDFSIEFVILTFTLDPDQNNCLEESEYEFFVNPGVIISFELETVYCSNDSENYELPIESLENYDGNWFPSEFVPEDLDDGEHVFVFTGEDPSDCIQPFELTIEVTEAESPTFNIPDTLCTNELPFVFPTISNEGIIGFFEVDSIQNTFTNDTLISNLFIPGSENCTEEFTAQIFIEFLEPPIFSNLKTSICAEDIPFVYPAVTTNGITGNWLEVTLEGNFINDTIVENSFIYSSGFCTDTITYQFDIIVEESPNFNLPNVLCARELPYIFPNISNNGIPGNWLPSSIESIGARDTIITSIFTFNNGLCQGQYTHQINITNRIEPTFNLPQSFCENDPEIIPNPTSLENIAGFWTPESFVPSFMIADSVILIWKPIDLNSCVDTSVHVIYKEEKIDNKFFLDDTYCLGEEYNFPLQNQNGTVEGTWEINNINEINISGSYTNTFSPEDSYCADFFTFDFTVLDSIQPEFDLPEYLCFDEENFLLPTESINSIVGIWNIEEIEIEIENNYDQVIELEFTSTENCTYQYTWPIYITQPYDILINKNDPSECGVKDGVIEIETGITNLEFSIDGGTNWTEVQSFNNLGSATYTLLVRNENYPNCISEEIVILEGQDVIDLAQSIVINDTDCQTDVGSIRIQPLTIEPLQFSIDGGINWQDSPLFNNLAPGSYTVDIRRVGEESCLSLIETIEGPQTISVTDINLQLITSCLNTNGSIDINATGLNLIYSINDGIDFQSSNSFTGLPDGLYDIIIQSESFENCDIDTFVILTAPVVPDLNLDFVIEPTACSESNGSISVISSDSDVEFSIDDGINWQMNNLFTNLLGGTYTVTVRNTIFTDCISELEINLITQEEIFIDYATVVVDPIGCNATNGIIEIINNSSLALQYKLEGTDDFTTTPLFDNLAEGIYAIEVVSQINSDCNSVIEITLEEQDCECQTYLLDLTSSDVSCDGNILGSIQIEPYIDETIIWDNNLENFNLTGLETGQYSFTITYQDQECQYLDTVNIIQPDPLDFALKVFPTDCEESQNGIIEIDGTNGGIDPYLYSIDGEDYQDVSGFYNLSAAAYNIFVQDLEGCVTMKEALVEISKDIDIELANSINISSGETVILNPLIEPSSIDSFKWTPIEFILNPGELIAEVQPEESIAYTLSIYYDACVEIRTINIIVEQKQSDLFIPNVINGNSNNNSTFYIQSAKDNNDIQASLQIYDRWGNLVFSNSNLIINDPNSGWSPSQTADYIQGVYVYVIKYSQNNVEQNPIMGSITVLR